MAVTETRGVQAEDVKSFKTSGKKPPLYAARKQIYPKRVHGTFRRVKWAMLLTTLFVYYTVPWLRWDRGPGLPDQAVLIDLPARRAYFFFIEFWPQEVYYVTGLLILGALGLFLVTSVGGRVWCGYACPQTVWTDLFMAVERIIEGDRNARIKFDRQPFSLAKAARKIAKHGIWMLIALATGGAWILYFINAPTAIREIFTGQAATPVYFFIGLFASITYLLAGWAREQVCTYMCPWPRFQAAMFDEETLIVTYRDWRGEPRGPYRRGQSHDEQGDCVACNQCVAVCPTGIDIRDGQQMECIGCGLCIDACDAVMDHFGRPRGLIALDTAANQVRRTKNEPPRFHILRPRVLVYAALLAIVATIMVGMLATRATIHINVLRDRAPLFVLLSNGDIRNGYTLKLSNMRRGARTFGITIDGIRGATMTIVGHEPKNAMGGSLDVGRDTVASFRIFITAPRSQLKPSSTPLTFVLTNTASGETKRYRTVFRGPET